MLVLHMTSIIDISPPSLSSTILLYTFNPHLMSFSSYQVLSDERLRFIYDQRGREGVEGSAKVDANQVATVSLFLSIILNAFYIDSLLGTNPQLFLFIFGSDKFEHVIGELQVLSTIQTLVQQEGRFNNPKIEAFRQRKREVQCAVNLASKLDEFVEGYEDPFRQSVINEAKELASNRFGATLLTFIGKVYIEKATSRLSSLGSFTAGMSSFGRAISDVANVTYSGIEVTINASKLYASQRDLENRKEAAEEYRETKTKFGISLHDENVRQKVQAVSASMITLIWHLTRMDVLKTLDKAIRKVLDDKTVDPAKLLLRAKTLLMCGEEYYSTGRQNEAPLHEFIERVDKDIVAHGGGGGRKDDDFDETGTFPSSSPSSSNPSSPENHSENPLKSNCTLSDVEFMPIRELKGHITLRGGDPSRCLEKKDLKKCLSLLIINEMTAAEIKECIVLLSFNAPEAIPPDVLCRAAEESNIENLRNLLKSTIYPEI